MTGEKPRPSQRDNSQLEDDVLYAIFLILYEKDPDGQGMTVKQICDVLVAQHPEMASLLTKTLNLVSAKLNAYVKRVEKGDVNLKYALLREWKDALPKRMVYVYRGLLTLDFHLHLAGANGDGGSGTAGTAGARSQLPATTTTTKLAPAARRGSGATGANGDDSLALTKFAAINKPRRQTMWDLGVTRHTFSDPDKSHLFVPYSAAPVAAAFTSLAPSIMAPGARSGGGANGASGNGTASGTDGATSDADDIFSDDDAVLFDVDVFNKHGKRLKLMLALGLKKRPLTAAAAAPRAPRGAPHQHSPTAAAAAAALHAAALKAISALTAALQATVAPGAPSPRQPWLRPGVLSQDIGAPEDTSLSDIDKFFA